MEVSAREDINISEMFAQLSMKIISNLEVEMALDDASKRQIQRGASNIMIIEPASKKKECC